MQSALVTIYQVIRQRIYFIKRFSLLLLSSITLTACASTNVEGISVDGKDSLIVIKNTSIFEQCKPTHPYEDNDSSYFLGVRCLFKGKAPDKFTVTYVVWFDNDEDTKRFQGKQIQVNVEDKDVSVANYITIDGQVVSRSEWIALGNKNRNQAIAQLPDSAWQTYTVDVKNTLERYEGKTPKGEPMGIVIPLGWGTYFPSLFPSLQDRVIQFDLLIDKEGKVELEEDYRWKNVLPNNPYS